MPLVDRFVLGLLPDFSLALAPASSDESPKPTPNPRTGTQVVRGTSPSTSPRERDAATATRDSSDIPCSRELSPQQTATVGPVLLVSPWYRPAVGGVVEVAEQLLRAFTDAGVQTHLLIAHEGTGGLEADPDTPCLWRLASVSSAFHHLSVKSILATIGRGSLAYWHLHRFVRRYKIKTVVVIYPISYTWLFLLLHRATDIRLIVSVHGNDVTKYDTYEVSSRWLIRHVLRNCDAIISCASHLLHKVQEIVRDHPHIELIPNCVDGRHFTPPPPGFVRTDPRRTFVHVSNFAPKKRTVDIVEAFADAKIPSNTRLIMVGDGPERLAAVERARSLGVDHRLEFVGMQKDVRPFLWQADVFLLASDDEGAPLALLEAMACGLPWVSTAWGPADMLPPRECGLVVPAHSPQLLAAAMAELIQNPEEYKAMGQRARHRTETDFRKDEYINRHLDLIRCVERSSSGSGVG
jgi:glycosyltransferase involved in cell wall biosynthesis